VSAERNRIIRPLGLIWRRLGSARIYFAAIAAVVLALAAFGLWHLIVPLTPGESSRGGAPIVKATPPSVSPAKASPTSTAIARVSPGAEQSSQSATAPPVFAPENAQQMAITDVNQREQRGRHGETFVVATIGIASRTNVEHSAVEIHVYFYDLTPTNEMRPTDAQVTYQWLTPVRDWSDPSPKYLAATYLKRPTRYGSFEPLRYGGFIVRIYSGGKLQDERSQPESLLSQLRSNASTPPTLSRRNPASRDEGGSTAPVTAAPSPTPPQNVASTKPTASTVVSPSASSPTNHSSPVTDSSSESLPYGKPIAGKPGFVSSPYDPKFLIDVRGFPPGTLVIDPNTNKPFRVP